MKRVSRRIIKILLIALSLLLSIGTTLSYIISRPNVQQHAIQVAQKILSRQLGTEVRVGKVDIGLPNKFILEDLHLDDPHGNKVAGVGRLKLDILSFSVWEWILSEDHPQRVYVRYIELDSVSFQLQRFKDSTTNLDFLKNPQVKERDSIQRALYMHFPEVHISHGTFSFVDSTKAGYQILKPQTINFRNFGFNDIMGDFSVKWDAFTGIDINLDNLFFKETYSGFELEELSTNLVFRKKSNDQPATVSFQELDIRAQQTRLYGSWTFPQSDLGEVFDQWLGVYSELNLTSSFIDSKTLSYFSGNLPVRGVFQTEGVIKGTFDRLESDDLFIRYKDTTALFTHLILRNIDDAYAPLDLDIRIVNSTVNMTDLYEILPELEIPPGLIGLGQPNIEGTFTGSPTNFDIDMDLSSKIGTVGTILKVELPDSDNDLLAYSGYIRSEALVWDLLNLEPPLKSNRLNLQGKINGVGTSLQDLNARLDVIITDSDLWSRTIDSVYANVEVADRQLEGELQLLDSEGRGDVYVDLDFTGETSAYKVRGTVDRLNMKKYLGYEEPIKLSAQMDVDLSGDSIDNLNGDLNMYQILLSRTGDSSFIQIPDLWFQAQGNTRTRKYFMLRSALLDADLGGNFSFKQAITLTQRLAYETQLFIENDSAKIHTYYQEKELSSSKVEVNLGVATRDSINQLFEFLGKQVFISPDAVLTTQLDFGISDRAKISVSLDSAHVQDMDVSRTEVNLDVIKYTNENSLLMVGGSEISRMYVTPKLYYRDVSFNINGLNRVIGSDLIAFQGNSENKIQAKLETSFPDNGRIVSSFDSSYTYFLFEGDSLRVKEWNTITYFSTDKRWLAEDFLVSGERGLLSIEGAVSTHEDDILDVHLLNFDLQHLEVLYPMKYTTQGMLDAKVEMTQVLVKPTITSSVSIFNFTLNEYTYGDIFFAGGWNQGKEQVDFQAKLVGQKDTTLLLLGNYLLGDQENPLNVDIITRNSFPLNYIEPFVEGELYGIRGQVSLESFKVRGDIDDLQVSGMGQFDKAHVGIDYLKSDYDFGGQITFDNDRIIFPRITLYDKYNNTADLHGNIYHKGFQEFEFDIQLDQIKDFLIVDTRKEDNKLYYGSLYLKNGIASITGNLDQLDIQAYVMSGAGSQLNIPVTEEEGVEKPDYIRFIGENDGKPLKVNTGIQGFELNLSILATSDARVDLIFDEKVGDIIRMRGKGTINMKINEQGDFSMFGTYEIEQGDYLFTARNVLNKKFKVKPGGTISWSGDPYEARLNVDAIYSLFADIKDLIRADATRRVPTNVLMHMEGSLLQPEISLDIELPNLRESDVLDLSSLLRTVTYDEQELNKQVFSLMVFNRFAPVGGFWENDVANTGVTTSVSELLSNQLNYWLSQALSDDINVNVGTSNFQDVNLLISAQLFNDRVTIERDGVLLGQGTEGITVGNIRIIIRLIKPENVLLQNGELVLEIFNRENLDFSQQFSSQRGLGIFYKRDFDNLKNILQKGN